MDVRTGEEKWPRRWGPFSMVLVLFAPLVDFQGCVVGIGLNPQQTSRYVPRKNSTDPPELRDQIDSCRLKSMRVTVAAHCWWRDHSVSTQWDGAGVDAGWILEALIRDWKNDLHWPISRLFSLSELFVRLRPRHQLYISLASITPPILTSLLTCTRQQIFTRSHKWTTFC